MACDPHPHVQKYLLEKPQMGQSIQLCSEIQLPSAYISPWKPGAVTDAGDEQ